MRSLGFDSSLMDLVAEVEQMVACNQADVACRSVQYLLSENTLSLWPLSITIAEQGRSLLLSFLRGTTAAKMQ